MYIQNIQWSEETYMNFIFVGARLQRFCGLRNHKNTHTYRTENDVVSFICTTKCWTTDKTKCLQTQTIKLLCVFLKIPSKFAIILQHKIKYIAPHNEVL